MKLEIINIDKISLTEQFIEDTLNFIKNSLIKKQILPPFEKRKLVIVFVSGDSMKKLNSQFRNKNQSTDILSFSPLEKGALGELALCVPTIQSQAQKEGLTLEEETAYLILHGLLHLLGYHHEEGGEPARLMYQIQDDIFDDWRKNFKRV